jgi:hypothetical protein
VTDGNAIVPSASDLEDLRQAVRLIERPGFAARLAERAGQPVNRIVGFLPKFAHDRLYAVVKRTVWDCLETAVEALPPKQPRRPSNLVPKLITGFTGGVGGVFGMFALPFELPITTTLMFMSIADIARHEGEDLSQLEARLACLQVFALGDRRSGGGDAIGYYAARAVLTKLTNDVASYLVVDRGVVEASTPVMTRLLGEIVSRFGFVVSERAAAGAVPVVAAVGGAAVNMIFMEHFQRIAQGHFIVRRLERKYGAATVQSLYRQLAAPPAGGVAALPAGSA